MDFQTRITQLIKAEGVPDLARRLGVSRQTVYHWKNGAVQPNLKNLQQVGGVVTFPEAEKLEDVRPDASGQLLAKASIIAASIPGVTTAAALEHETHYEIGGEYAQD